LFRSTAALCEGRVAADSIYGILHRECFALFPDEMFADLFKDVGRRSVPPMIVAVVMVLQRIGGCSDREAADRFAFDARWKYACGGLDFGYPGFAHTVLADMRARPDRSERPDRIFEVTLAAARQAGLAGRRRVLDSAPLYDAVATMDTVTLARSAVRGLLRAAGAGLEAGLRGVLRRDDDYAAAGKPACGYDDPAAREELVNALACDALAVLAVLEGRELEPAAAQAAALLATVTGQDLEQDAAGAFRIARRAAPGRVISTVDPQARHGRKTRHRSFGGYKGHVAVDPDSEVVTAIAVTPGSSGDAGPAGSLPAGVLPAPGSGPGAGAAAYGDSAYGTGELVGRVQGTGMHCGLRVQPPPAVKGHFPKDRFAIDLPGGTVTCPAGVTAAIRPSGRDRHAGQASFGTACRACPLAAQCTTAPGGRTIAVGPHEAALAAARHAQQDPAWRAGYNATRPKVERKTGHLMRRRHGGRRARVRGQHKVAADFALLAAAVSLARLAVPGLARRNGTWTAAAAG
jgi:hypothetical protein